MVAVRWADPKTPALAIVARGDQIRAVSPNEYIVRSQSRLDTAYRVTASRDRWGWTCQFFQESGRVACIHIYAVRFRDGLKDTALPAFDGLCARCQSGNVIRRGTRRNKSGEVPRFECKPCGYRFTSKDGFARRRVEPEKIALALDLYFRRMSVRKIAEHFGQVYSLNVSHVTVYRWVACFGTLGWLPSGWTDGAPGLGNDGTSTKL